MSTETDLVGNTGPKTVFTETNFVGNIVTKTASTETNIAGNTVTKTVSTDTYVVENSPNNSIHSNNRNCCREHSRNDSIHKNTVLLGKVTITVSTKNTHKELNAVENTVTKTVSTETQCCRERSHKVSTETV